MGSNVPPVDAVGPSHAADLRAARAERTAPAHGEVERSAAASLHSRGGRIEIGGRVAQFSYDEAAGRVVVAILSDGGEPREIVRQIPAEEYLAFVARFREMLGVLFDDLA